MNNMDVRTFFPPKTMNRPTIEEVQRLLHDLGNQPLDCPQSRNKGVAGLLLEKLTGIPTSSAHIDCSNGEVKIFPLKALANGTLVPKETIAVTMLNKLRLVEEAEFETSNCGTKLRRTLYVPYRREGDTIRLFPASDLCMTPAMCADLSADYTSIRGGFQADGTLSSSTGAYLQCRTKGRGGDAPKTRAFYLRKEFIHKYVTKTW